MNKIFISHNQDFAPSRSVKSLINMLGAYGLLVEDEPGSEPLKEKSFKYLRQAQGFLAICTKDLQDQNGLCAPKNNVCLEIKEWQEKNGGKNMIVIKQIGCQLPGLLGDPTYCGEFQDLDFILCVEKALREFQSLGLIPYGGKTEDDDENIELTEKEKKLLLHLSESNKKKMKGEELRARCNLNMQEWNIAIHKLRGKSGSNFILYYEQDQWSDERAILTDKGMQYLLNQGLIKT